MRRTTAPGHDNNKFTEGNPVTGSPPPTTVGSDWMNIMQEELANLVEYTGAALDQSNSFGGTPAHNCTQIREAIVRLLGKGAGGVGAIAYGASPYTLLRTKKIVPFDSSLGNILVNLPDATTVEGETWLIAKTSGDANTLTLDGFGSQTINGELTQVISNQWTAYRLTSLGALGWLLH